MFDNIGGKIKGLAIVICILGITGSVIYGVTLMGMAEKDEEMALTGFIVLIVGSLASWIGTFFMYGFGELIETNAQTKDELTQIKKELYKLSKNQGNPDNIYDGDATQIRVSFCGKCGNKIEAYPCPHCGNFENNSAEEDKTKILQNYGYVECPSCGLVQNNTNKVCQQCSKVLIKTDENAPYYCQNCGTPGPYAGDCPTCGGSIKSLNFRK